MWKRANLFKRNSRWRNLKQSSAATRVTLNFASGTFNDGITSPPPVPRYASRSGNRAMYTTQKCGLGGGGQRERGKGNRSEKWADFRSRLPSMSSMVRSLGWPATLLTPVHLVRCMVGQGLITAYHSTFDKESSLLQLLNVRSMWILRSSVAPA